MKRATGSILCLAYTAVAGFAPLAAGAQDGEDPILDEIIVTGTRRLDRTVSDSPVPVDVFRGEQLQNMGTGDMDDVLRTLIPSYNVERFPIADEASLIRPATLRGMPADFTLILLNGKRRHRGGIVSGFSNGPDVSAIPAVAIQRLELLRDGASAQYGSDAIAGVINFVTRTDDTGLMAEVEFGRFFAGDGEAAKFAGNAGFSLTESGFVNASLEYGYSDWTSRAVQRPDAAAIEAAGATGIPNPAQRWGQPEIDDDLKVFVNSAIELSQKVEWYGFGNYSERTVELEFNYRNAYRTDGIYSFGPERLVFDLTADGSGDCPLAGSPNAVPAPHPLFLTQADYDADVIALAAIGGDPNCWVVNEVYPSGYKPFYGATIRDLSAVTGVRGELGNGLLYDVSAAYGANGVAYTIRDTINASLGPASPNSFRPGRTRQADTALNVDLALPVVIDRFASPLNVAAGFEWREESFEVVAGDEGSWIAGPLALQGATIGSHGFPGYSPDQAGSWARSNIAVYVDLEADLTESLSLGLAGRYEDFEDFGSTTNGKFAFMYRFNDVFGLRGSVGTGFRAPTPGLSNLTKTSTIFSQGELLQIGTIPPTNPVAVFYGGKPLESQDATNISAGVTIEPFDNLTFTADYYRIENKNAISISRFIFITPEDRATLIGLRVPGATDFAAVQFNGNDIDATTTGYDLVASYVLDWSSAGSTDLSLAWNHTENEIRVDGVPPSRNSIVRQENAMRYRGTLSATHNWNDWRFQVRASYYDGWVSPNFRDGPLQPVCSDERPASFDTDGCYGDNLLVDIEAAYTIKDHVTIIAGADNVFDRFPDTHFLYPDFSFGRIYPTNSPIGFNGGFWYLRLRAEF